MYNGRNRKGELTRSSRMRTGLTLAPRQGSLNARINIFYMLDTLCDPITSANSLPSTSSSSAGPSNARVTELPYAGFLERDLETLVGFVVPKGKEGMLNLLSAKQVSSLARMGAGKACLLCTAKTSLNLLP